MIIRKSILVAAFSWVIFFATHTIANETTTSEELKQLMVFDQACITMHQEGRKYLENKERIAQSYGASALIEKNFESRLTSYIEETGNDIEVVRKSATENGSILFKELSEYQPRDLVKQCRDLVESIVKANF